MRRIIKLTPATIKRIIAEERQKIQKEEEALLKEGKEKLIKKLRLLKKIKDKYPFYSFYFTKKQFGH